MTSPTRTPNLSVGPDPGLKSEGLAAMAAFAAGKDPDVAAKAWRMARGENDDGAPTSAQAPESAVDHAAEAAEQRALLKGLQSRLGAVDETKKKLDDLCKKHDIQRQELDNILDQIVIQNVPYRKTYKVMRGVDVTFRTRDHEEREELERLMSPPTDSLGRVPPAFHWRISLAASTSRFGTSNMSDWTTAQRVRWVQGLSEPLYNILLRKLQSFDQLVRDVTDEDILALF